MSNGCVLNFEKGKLRDLNKQINITVGAPITIRPTRQGTITKNQQRTTVVKLHRQTRGFNKSLLRVFDPAVTKYIFFK